MFLQKRKKPTVSIIIPLNHDAATAERCILSILQNTREIDYEIIALNISTKEKKYRPFDSKGRIIDVDVKGKGLYEALNQQLQSVGGTYLAILNHQTVVKQDWLKYMLKLMEHDQTLGIVGPKILYPDGKLCEAGGVVWKKGILDFYGKSDDQGKSDYCYVRETDFVSSKCLLIRSDLWRKIKGFDTRLETGGYGDVDLAFQARKHGYKVIYQPRSVIVYEGQETSTDNQNGEVFCNKWRKTLEEHQFSRGQHIFWARDRSSRKKTILMFYTDGPDFDRSTASRMAFHYLQLFVQMGLHVIYAGVGFKRNEPYTSILEQMGIQVVYKESEVKSLYEWIIHHKDYIDYAYLIFPFIAQKYMDILRHQTKAKIFYNGCDLFFLRERRNYDLTKDPKLLESSENWKTVEANLIKEADINHTLSTYEKNLLRQWFPEKKVRLVPVFIYNDTNIPGRVKPFSKREGLLFVGTFNHKPNVDAIRWFTRHIFPKIVKQIPDIKFYIVGLSPPATIKALKSKNIIVTGYVSDKELESYYKKCRVVVAPLRFGAGVKGKIVEAMRYRVPVVTTEIGAEGFKGIKDYIYIAKNEREFARNVLDLYTREKLWTQASNNNLKYIKRHFSMKAAKEQMDKDIQPNRD